MGNMMKIVVSVLLLLLTGCRVQETTTNHTSASTFIERVLVDSVALRDSIVIRERSDTVFFTKYSTLYKERVRVDTVIKCDTVYTERMVSVKEKGNANVLWWLLIPLVAVLWKVGFLDLLRSLIMNKIK